MSTIQEAINQRNTLANQMSNLNSEDYINKYKSANAAKQQAEVDASNKSFDDQITNTKAAYGKLIEDEKIAYEDQYQKNAVQKLINEQQIAEHNANLGLTDSGLNRTQQTAVQLSYANQKGDIDIARQSKLDELTL